MLIGADASGLEWRTLLELSGDKTGIAEIFAGEDVHGNNQKFLRLPEGKEGRLVAKVFLFRAIYRGTGWAFAHDPDFMHVSTRPSYWDDLLEKLFTKYNGIDACHNEWMRLSWESKPIVGPLGRQWLLAPKLDEKKGGLYVSINQVTNYPVQGTGADLVLVARVSMANKIKRLGWPVKPIMTVHDSIVYDCPPEYTQPMVDLFHETFDGLQANIKKLFGYDWVVPVGCEVKVGMNIKDMKPLDRSIKV